MDENTVFCCSCGARQNAQDATQPATGNTINTASAEAAASSSESTQPGLQSPSQQQDSGRSQQEFAVQPPRNQIPSQNTIHPQYAMQPQSTMPFQSTVQPQSAVKQRDIMKPMSVWQFLLMFIILAVPILNIVKLFTWAFGSKANQNKKNLSRAYLILFVFMIVLWIAVGASIMSIFSGITGSPSSFNDMFKKAGEEMISNMESKSSSSGLELGKATSMLLDSDISKWPKDRLHSDMPEYKKGKLNGWNQWDSTNEYSIFILIKDTGKADLDEYISQLKSAGFTAINSNSFRKGIYDVEFQFNSDTILQISSYKADIFEWPKELVGIPPITKGNLTAVTGPSEDYPDGIQLYYINLTVDDLMKWGKSLEAKGFEVDGLAISKSNADFNGKTYNSLYLQIEENGSDEWIIDFMYSE